MINLEGYRVFLKTAKLGNQTKAAKELFITQPTVSYLLKQMELEFGLQLFYRLSKGVELTKEGEVLMNFVEQAFSLLEEGEKRIINMKHLAEGELRIAIGGTSIYKKIVYPEIIKFHKQYSKIKIHSSFSRDNEIAKQINNREYDFGIIYLPIKEKEKDVRIIPLTFIEDIFVVGKYFETLTNKKMKTSDLINIPLLLPSNESSLRIFTEQWFENQGYIIKANIELGSMNQLLEFAVLGYGITLVSRSFVEKQLKDKVLFEVQTIEPIPPRKIGIILHKEMPTSLAASFFLESLGVSV